VHRTPYIASFTQSVIAAIIVLLFAIFGGTNDPNTQAYLELYGLMALVGTILIVAAQAVVSLAIISYFRTHHPEDHHWWRTLVAPLIAFVAQVVVLYLCIANMDFLGGGFQLADWIVWIDLAVLAVGILGALYFKYMDPKKYEQIGRLIYEGLPDGMLADAERAQPARR
jgi:amino acid transporter